jgi:hypothetical protein
MPPIFLIALLAVGGWFLLRSQTRVVTKYITTQPDEEPAIVSELTLEGSYTKESTLHQVQIYEAPPWTLLDDGDPVQGATSWQNALTALDDILQLSFTTPSTWSFEAFVRRGEQILYSLLYSHGLAEAIDQRGAVVFSQSDSTIGKYPVKSKALSHMIEFVQQKVTT